eukprot:CAMPEP_0185769480 /NCGR_PEP_ID=MMETSP1174-20130828/54239_1 /TAXON_ID=35687 /ORGANISM="Dictyocha speculum, Strain CCMP1381" /LENGTH=39 /DNA_ID= /DNA_START= /DNA_END= /DNA_ORIENTATION=
MVTVGAVGLGVVVGDDVAEVGVPVGDSVPSSSSDDAVGA